MSKCEKSWRSSEISRFQYFPIITLVTLFCCTIQCFAESSNLIFMATEYSKAKHVKNEADCSSSDSSGKEGSSNVTNDYSLWKSEMERQHSRVSKGIFCMVSAIPVFFVGAAITINSLGDSEDRSTEDQISQERIGDGLCIGAVILEFTGLILSGYGKKNLQNLKKIGKEKGWS